MLLLPFNLIFNPYIQSVYINKRFQSLVQVCLRYYIYQVILAISPLNFKEFLLFIELLKCYNINYKALLFYSTNVTDSLSTMLRLLGEELAEASWLIQAQSRMDLVELCNEEQQLRSHNVICVICIICVICGAE